MQKFSLITKMFIAAVVITGAAVLVNGLLHWETSRPIELAALLVMSLIASRLKVRLPGINGTMSVNVPYLLIVAVRLSLGEALAIAALASLIQSIPACKDPGYLCPGALQFGGDHEFGRCRHTRFQSCLCPWFPRSSGNHRSGCGILLRQYELRLRWFSGWRKERILYKHGLEWLGSLCPTTS